MDGKPQSIADADLLPGDLAELFDELRFAGFNVGVEQYNDIHRLILKLGADRNLQGDRHQLKAILSPLVCTSPTEQRDFYRRFDQWCTRHVAAEGSEQTKDTIARSDREKELEKAVRGMRKRTTIVRRGIAALVGVLCASFPYQYSASSPFRFLGVDAADVVDDGNGRAATPHGSLIDTILTQNAPFTSDGSSVATTAPPDQQPKTADTRPYWQRLGFLFGAPLTLILIGSFVLSWWIRRPYAYFVTRTIHHDPEISGIRLRGLPHALFHSTGLFQTAQRLRTHRVVPENVLDAEETAEATARHGGLFTPVLSRRRVVPEYLILIDQSGHQNRQSCLVDELVNELEDNGLVVSRYYFDGDPKLCFPVGASVHSTSLSRLVALFPDHRLLIFSDGEGFIDPLNGMVASWVPKFERWSQRALLTFHSVADWSDREWMLSRHFILLPASEEGLASLARCLLSEPDAALPATATGRPYPELLRQRPERWLERHPPPRDVVETLLAQLREYLGNNAYDWICACAVYPSLEWNVLINLGQQFQDDDDTHLISESGLLALVRLPWFRHGPLPDWLRSRLIRDLTPARETRVRNTFETLFLSAMLAPSEAIVGPLPENRISSDSIPAQTALRMISRRVPRGSPLKDPVFTTFMANPLRVRIPKSIRRRLSMLVTSRGGNLRQFILTVRDNVLKTSFSMIESLYKAAVWVYRYVWAAESKRFVRITLLACVMIGLLAVPYLIRWSRGPLQVEVSVPTPVSVGQLNARVRVNTRNVPSGGKLSAWIDFDGDGSWGGLGERIAANVPGNGQITFGVPSWSLVGETSARFRLSTTGDMASPGVVAGGDLKQSRVSLSAPSPGGMFGGQQVIDMAQGAQSVFPADVDGDGDMDVLSAAWGDDQIAWHENPGNAFGWTAHIISGEADGAASVFAEDMDGDDDLDVLAVSNEEHEIAWYENTTGDSSDDPWPHRTISNKTRLPISVFPADVDGDGDFDVLSVSASDGKIAWHENNERPDDGPWPAHTITNDAAGARSVFAVDLDRDGDIDALSALSVDSKIAWYENNGTPKGDSWPVQTISGDAAGAQSVFAADLDKDGDIDVLSASVDDNKIAWYENDNRQTFAPHLISTTTEGAWSVFAADVDGDGDMDVLSTSIRDNRIAWHENDGSPKDGGWTAHTISTATLSPRSVFAADVDGDGDLDVLSASERDDKVAWYQALFQYPPRSSFKIDYFDDVIVKKLEILPEHFAKWGPNGTWRLGIFGRAVPKVRSSTRGIQVFVNGQFVCEFLPHEHFSTEVYSFATVCELDYSAKDNPVRSGLNSVILLKPGVQGDWEYNGMWVAIVDTDRDLDRSTWHSDERWNYYNMFRRNQADGNLDLEALDRLPSASEKVGELAIVQELNFF